MTKTATIAVPEVEPLPFTVIGTNIVVELIERDEVTTSGIVLAGVEKKRPSEVVVVAVGTGCPLAIGTGVVLHVKRHQMMRVEIASQGDRELYLLQPDAVWGIE